MIYESNKTTIFCNVSTSISSVIGNITGLYKDFITSCFPKEYFKEIFITTTHVSNEQNGEDDVIKKRLPQLSISPGYIPSADETTMTPYPKWRRAFKPVFRDHRFSGREVFMNDEDEIYIYAIPYRMKINFETKIKVPTHMEKLDILFYVKQMFENGEKFYLNNKYLETEIPKSIIKALSAIKGFNLEDEDDLENYFNYLKTYSTGYISKKKNLSTGNEKYSYRFPANILVIIENGGDADGRTSNKINMSDNDNVIDFSISFEMWIPSNYVMQTVNLPVGDYSPDLSSERVGFDFTLQTRPNRIRGEKTEIEFKTFITEVNTSIDEIDISSMFPHDYRDFLISLVEQGDYELLNATFELVCFRDNIELKPDDYEIDWKTLTMKLIHPYQNYVYSIISYGNRKLINENIDQKIAKK